MSLKMFGALPSYLGGKRRLVAEIFRHVSPPDEAPRFLDAFLGGGSVSLYAKARGYAVHANDISLRSVVVGRALIENDRTTIAHEDVLRLFAPNARATHFVEEHFAPDTFTTRCARFIDLALANAREMEEPKRSLALLLLVKFIFRVRPMGNFGAKTIVRQLEENAWDEMNQHYARESLNRRVNGPPIRNVEVIAEQINLGIFANGKENRVSQADVFEFLPKAEGDIVYLDPPYAGTTSYEGALRVIDSVLAGEEIHSDKSVFSQKDALGSLERLLDSSRHVPTLVLSFGNAETSLSDLVAIVDRHRRVTDAKEFAYAHCQGLAREETVARNRELLVVARAA